MLLDALLAGLAGWLLLPPAQVLTAYRARCATIGRQVTVQLADRSLSGRVRGITPRGELEVAAATGLEVVNAGDLVHVRAC